MPSMVPVPPLESHLPFPQPIDGTFTAEMEKAPVQTAPNIEPRQSTHLRVEAKLLLPRSVAIPAKNVPMQ